MQYATINETGLANLTEWLASVLTSGDLFAEEWASKLASEFDGSGLRPIEVSATKTRSGNPELYTFANDELDWHETED